MQRPEIIEILKQTLSPERVKHLEGTEEIAIQLAERFSVSENAAMQAALFHDLCREEPPETLLQLAFKFGILIDSIENFEPLLLHGVIAAKLMQKEYQIGDCEILEAVRYHVTGAAGVSRLAWLIFVADFIEPNRNFAEAKLLRDKAWQLTPPELVLEVYNYKITAILEKGHLLHPRTLAGRNEILLKTKGK